MTDVLLVIISVAVGLALGGWAASRLLRRVQEERERRVATEIRLQEIEKQLESHRALVDEATSKLGDTFKALSSDALRSNAQAFLDSARQTLEPLRQELKRYDDHVREMEGQTREAYGGLQSQLKALAESEQQLQRETTNLVNALRRPEVRGRWGEQSLRRAVELVGMTEHVDYVQQPSTETEGGRQRPDMIVHLPGGLQVIVDAKVSLDAYLEGLECLDEDARRKCLEKHCDQMKEHVRQLAAKSYWQQFDPTPEFVVMFVPGESFLQAACSVDSTLIERAMQQRVILASPTVFFAVLRAIALSWQQERVAKSAQQVSELGRDLYERLRTFLGHFEAVGKNLQRATTTFNQALGSLESRVLPSARRFRDLGAAGGEELPELEPVETQPRQLTAPESDSPDEDALL